MKCIKCGIELPEGANFCDMCGAPQTQNGGGTPVAAGVNSNMKCIKCGIDLPVGANFCDMCGAPQKQAAVVPAASNMQAVSNQVPAASNRQAVSNPVPPAPGMQAGAKNRLTYIMLCLFLGTFGIHNFYAGRKGVAIVQLLLFWTGISSIWAFIELFAVKKDGQGCPMNPCSKQTALIAIGAAVAMVIVFLFSLNHIVYGIGCCVRDIDANKANAIFVRAAAMGNANAMYEVGWRCEYYGETADAVEWYKVAAENGHVEAMLRLGRIYLNGFSTPEQAFAMFSMALENDNDNIDAQYEVASCKLFGIGTSKDAAMAFNLLKNIDESGEYNISRDLAQVYLAHCYLNGDGVAADVSKAIGYIRQGLGKNIPLASFLMAECLFYGKGVGQNYDEAAKFAKNAAVNGVVKAQSLLNGCFKRGNLFWNSTRELQEYAAKLKMTVDDKRVLVKNAGYAPLAVVPYGVVAIGEDAFAYSRMRNVEISDTVEYIASNAFRNCNELKEVIIPASVKKIGGAIFESCSNLEKVVVLSEQIDFDVTSICSISIVTKDIKADNLKEILISPRAGFDGNFQNLVKLLPLTERQKQGYDLCRVNSAGELLPVNRLHQTVIVPDGVVNLACGFQHDDYLCKICRENSCSKSSCDEWYRNPSLKRCQHKNYTGKKYFGRIENIVLPESVEDLGGGFANFTSLKKVNIPGKVKEIPSFAFADSSIERITLPGSIKKIGKAAFQNCDNLREITIPEGVTVIPKNAFIACDRLKKVVIPDSVKKIERGAFNGCPLLKTIEVSAGTIVDEESTTATGAYYGILGEYRPHYKVIRRQNAVKPDVAPAGRRQNAVKPDVVPAGRRPVADIAVSSAGYSLSNDGKTLISVPKNISRFAIPESVQTIEKKAFFACRNLEDVTIPQNVSTIGFFAFARCSSLKSIDLPDSVKRIEVGAFLDCRSLESIKIPEGVRFISSGAFARCTSLKQVVIPDGVRHISTRAFESCTSLKEVRVPARTRIGKGAFPDTCKVIRY